MYVTTQPGQHARSREDQAGVRAGQPLAELSAAQLQTMYDHPAQHQAFTDVATLIDQLRRCSEAADFVDLQTSLFSHALAVDERRAQCVRMAKRLRAGRRIPADAPEPPTVGDPNDVGTWEFEVLVHERLFRQFRAVGDGLAWRTFGYDRRIIAALSSNQSPGPLVKVAGTFDESSNGLNRELDVVRSIWVERGHFALLHDLTNCLRIGDATEVESRGHYGLHEVKVNPKSKTAAQTSRMLEAKRTIENGGPRPGTNMRVVDLPEPYRSDLATLADVIDLARRHGVRGAKLAHSRAIVVTSFAGLGRRCNSDIDAGTKLITSTRASSLRRAGITDLTHHLRATSADQAARIPLLPPWTIYPFSPADCAALICDQLVFETVLATVALAEVLMANELGVEVLETASGNLDPRKPVLRVTRGIRQLTLHPNALSPLLFELVHPVTWARGIVQLLDRPVPYDNPWTRFADDDQLWLPVIQ